MVKILDIKLKTKKFFSTKYFQKKPFAGELARVFLLSFGQLV